MDRAVIDGVTLEHEESGTGDPVVFIHGAFIAPAFRPLLSERALSDRYRLISYHRRGYVGSSRAEEPLSLAGQAGDCRRLSAHLGVQRAHVVGHSFGGVIALQLSLDAPQLRTVDDQRPRSSEEEAIVAAIRSHLADPHGFEACAAAIWAMYAPSTDYTLTAPSRDGGRDAYGYYKLGPESDPIRLDFALEAKCYGADNGVGVRDLSRLISRLRHRQFGVLVTTSYLAPQALMVVYEAGKCMVSVPRLGGAGVDLYRPIAPSRTRPTAETRARTSLTSISIIRAFSSLDGDVRRRGEA